MKTILRNHILKYSLIVILVKSVLFIAGTFIANQSMSMAFLSLTYLLAFCYVAISMIRNFQRVTKLKMIEKIFAIIVMFFVHEIWGFLLHSLYFIGILGQKPTKQELIEKAIEIVKFDSSMLIVMVIISIFINSKTVDNHEDIES